MNKEDIKELISDLAKKHACDDDFYELIENEAEMLIFNFSKEKNYQIDGVSYVESLNDEDMDDDEMNQSEQRKEYLSLLEKKFEDIADLMWHYVSSFWPDAFENKEEYLATDQ